MARSFSSAKSVSAFIANEISAVAARRGYTTQGGVSRGARTGAPNVMLKRGSEETATKTSWVPDPVTGYYRPETHAKELDAAELRRILIRNKTSGQ